jgi:hypothetical protein
MATVNLIFEGKSFPVPKKYLMELLDQHHELFQATTYAVESSVPVAVFQEFVNAASLPLLAREFFLPDLAAECSSFAVPADPISSLSDRVCQLELRVSSFSKPPVKIAEKIESQEEALENLRRAVERQRDSIDGQVRSAVSRVCKLERQVSSISHGSSKHGKEIESQERALENLRQDLGRQRESIDRKVAVVVSVRRTREKI